MYPEDRVLVCAVPEPVDFERIQSESWYRIPQKHAPKGIFAEYFAFYFGRKFGAQKWAVHYFARQQGYELLPRREIVQDQPQHPRADELYYRVALGPLQKLDQPIVSLRWRRISFMHTTWDRFQEAREINDLFLEGGEYVDRVYIALKERGLRPERTYGDRLVDGDAEAGLSIICEGGRIDIASGDIPEDQSELQKLIEHVSAEAERMGGPKEYKA